MSWRTWRDRIASAIAPAPKPTAQDEAELERLALRGARAKALLQDDMAQQFFADLEAKLVDRLVGLPLEDDAGRMRLAVAIQTQRQLREYLIAETNNGEAARQHLSKLERGRGKALWSVA